MHTIKTSFGSILRPALYLAGTPRSRHRKPETLRRLGGWLLRDLGVTRSEHETASEQMIMLRAALEL